MSVLPPFADLGLARAAWIRSTLLQAARGVLKQAGVLL